ncbi:MAG: biotin transporter BioY [FCB group bacterium]|nr:biotin transporter BioY [FCB group bacterium]
MNSNNLVIYKLVKPTGYLAEIPLLLSFNILLVVCAYLSINLSFSPVPVTGQTFGVLIIAMALGRTRGLSVIMAYLLEGAMGLPVFAGGTAGVVRFVGPTGGYLLGFLGAAFAVGYLADKGWDKGYFKSVLAMIIGTTIIFICGLLWLSVFVPMKNIFTVGLIPFIPGAIVKISVASVILPSIWKGVRYIK